MTFEQRFELKLGHVATQRQELGIWDNVTNWWHLAPNGVVHGDAMRLRFEWLKRGFNLGRQRPRRSKGKAT